MELVNNRLQAGTIYPTRVPVAIPNTTVIRLTRKFVHQQKLFAQKPRIYHAPEF